MIETTVSSLLSIKPIITKIANTPMAAKDSFKVLRILKTLDKEYELIEQTRLDCLRKYAELDGEGNFITHDDGSIIIAGEKQTEFNQEFNNFLKCKISLDCGKLNINIINELILTPAELIEIEMFFEEE